jgi:cyclase
MFTEVAPGVFSAEHRTVEGKNGVVLGARGALAIDSGNDLDEGRALAGFIRAQGRRPDRLALTHGHGDHILGSGAFEEAEIFAHLLTPEVMRAQIPPTAARTGESTAAVAASLGWPSVTFTGELRLDLGGKRVRIFPTPGHSPDGVAIYLVEDRVLFAGDTVVTGIVPAIGDGHSGAMEASLRTLARLDIAVLVAGHGPVLYGGATIRDWLDWQAGYLAGVRRFVAAELDRGSDPAAVAGAADYDRFIGDRLPADRHGMVRRHRAAVAKIVAEALERHDAVGASAPTPTGRDGEGVS